MPHRVLRWTLFAALLLAFILLPFAFFEDPMNAFTERLLGSGHAFGWVTLAVVLLLLADIVLPVPSSFVLASAGYLLGAPLGALAGFIGLSCASFAGYAIGRWAAEPLARRLVGEEQLARFSQMSTRHGAWFLVGLRGLPVLAEATVILAGMGRWPLPRFVAWVSLGNAVVALLYALLGAWSASEASFLGATLAAMAVPGLLMLAWKRLQARAPSDA